MGQYMGLPCMGTYGSRSLAVGGTAISKAVDKVIEKGKIIAAHMMEAAETDLEFKDGKFTVAGTDKEKSFGEIALSAYVPHNFPHEKLPWFASGLTGRCHNPLLCIGRVGRNRDATDSRHIEWFCTRCEFSSRCSFDPSLKR